MANDTCIEKKAIFVQYFNLMLMEWSNYNFFSNLINSIAVLSIIVYLMHFLN